MSIRLSKACKDLNVGMTTAVEFLAKKGHKLSVDPNLKLSDDLHLLLAKEFNKDMALKMESERLSQERHLKEKAGTVALEGYNKPVEKQAEKTVEKPAEKPVDVITTSIPKDQLPQIKAVGHIDLDALKKPAEHKPVVAKAEEKPEVTTVEAKEVQAVEKPVEKKEVIEEKPVVEAPVEKVVAEAKPEPVVEKQPEPVVETKAEVVEPVKLVLNKVETKVEETKATEKETPAEVVVTEVVEEEIFSLSRPTIDKAPVVIGTIDLDLLNQSTRPKPKTKEQKRKEREEKNRIVDPKKPFVQGDKKIMTVG
mgnify:FL=1